MWNLYYFHVLFEKNNKDLTIKYLPGVYKGFTVVIFNPANIQPKAATKNSGTFGNIKATTSSFCKFNFFLKLLLKFVAVTRISSKVYFLCVKAHCCGNYKINLAWFFNKIFKCSWKKKRTLSIPLQFYPETFYSDQYWNPSNAFEGCLYRRTEI